MMKSSLKEFHELVQKLVVRIFKLYYYLAPEK